MSVRLAAPTRAGKLFRWKRHPESAERVFPYGQSCGCFPGAGFTISGDGGESLPSISERQRAFF